MSRVLKADSRRNGIWIMTAENTAKRKPISKTPTKGEAVDVENNSTNKAKTTVPKKTSESSKIVIDKKSSSQLPLVSIIIPIFNAEKTLERAIRSVKNQTYQNWELILIDDCSNDNSLKLMQKQKNKRIKAIQLKTNSGPAIARNAGIKIAKGDFICFLDADDIWDAKKIEKQINFMNEKDCAFSFTSYKFADENGHSNKTHSITVREKMSYRDALKNTTIFTSTVMFNMHKIAKEDIYMVDVKSEDTATWWKILKKIDYAHGFNEPLSFYCRSSGTLSSNKIEAIRRIWYLYRKVEHLSFPYSIYCFCGYGINAVRRRL